MTVTPTDDITALLEQDHEAIRERLSELETAHPDDRATLFAELTAALTRHEVAEEMVVYPALRHEQGGAAVVEALLGEETAVEELLVHIGQLDTATEEFVGALRDLRAVVLSHTAHEEDQVVPMLLALGRGADLALLGQKFRGKKLGPFVSFVDRLRDPAGTAGEFSFPAGATRVDPKRPTKGTHRGGTVLILLLLLLVLILAGAGFAVHVLWIAAIIFAVFWLVGVALGRGESAGNRHFYNW